MNANVIADLNGDVDMNVDMNGDEDGEADADADARADARARCQLTFNVHAEDPRAIVGQQGCERPSDDLGSVRWVSTVMSRCDTRSVTMDDEHQRHQ